MKRSEMLKELYKICDSYQLDPFIAERMLDDCEEAGMDYWEHDETGQIQIGWEAEDENTRK